MRQLKTKEEYEEVKNKSTGKLIVIDFYATWCPPCQQIAPYFEELAKKYPAVEFYKVDVDENEETTVLCGVEAMPTFQFYKDGKKVDEVSGASKAEVEQAILKHQ